MNAMELEIYKNRFCPFRSDLYHLLVKYKLLRKYLLYDKVVSFSNIHEISNDEGFLRDFKNLWQKYFGNMKLNYLLLDIYAFFPVDLVETIRVHGGLCFFVNCHVDTDKGLVLVCKKYYEWVKPTNALLSWLKMLNSVKWDFSKQGVVTDTEIVHLLSKYYYINHLYICGEYYFDGYKDGYRNKVFVASGVKDAFAGDADKLVEGIWKPFVDVLPEIEDAFLFLHAARSQYSVVSGIRRDGKASLLVY